MAVVQLASAEDVELALGRDLTATEAIRVESILDKASELFRRRSGQHFTAGTSEVRLRVIGDKVTLTQRPVVSVESVTEDEADGEIVDYDLYQSTLTLDCPRGGDFVRVEYTHGGDVPDLVRLAIAEIAKKVLLISDAAQAGSVSHSETTGPFSESDTYATWAQGGQTMLAPADAALADSYRVRTYGAIVTVP